MFGLVTIRDVKNAGKKPKTEMAVRWTSSWYQGCLKADAQTVTTPPKEGICEFRNREKTKRAEFTKGFKSVFGLETRLFSN